MENLPITALAAEPDKVDVEEQIWLRVAHHIRAPYASLSATTDNDSDGTEEEQPHPRRSAKITSSRLRTVDKTALMQVLLPHKLFFTPDGQPASYHSLSCMAFVNGYLSIMALQMDIIRNKMAIHLHEIMDDDETFGWPWGLAPEVGTRQGHLGG